MKLIVCVLLVAAVLIARIRIPQVISELAPTMPLWRIEATLGVSLVVVAVVVGGMCVVVLLLDGAIERWRA